MSIKSFLITLCIGVIISFFFFKSCNKPAPSAPIITAPAVLVKNVVTEEKSTAIKVDSLQELLNLSVNKVYKLNLEQSNADRTIKMLREKISLIGNQEPTTSTDFETSKAELFAEIDKLNHANDHRDSLCDATVSTLQSSGIIKDSIIGLKDRLYNNLRINFDTAISNNQKLLNFSKLQNKQIQNGKAVGFIWKVAALAAGVFIAKQSL